MAQRLVRSVCESCKEAYEPDAKLLPSDFPYDGRELYRGSGCRECRGSGFRGRTGIFELLLMNDEIRELVMQRSGTARIIEAARRNGLILLREDGWRRVLDGITTPEEILRVSKI